MTRSPKSFSRSPRSTHEAVYLAMVLVPLLLLLAFLAYGAWQQLSASASVKASESSVDASTSVFHLDVRIPPSHREKWWPINEEARYLESKYQEGFEILDETQSLVPPDQSWSSLPLAEQYHQEAAPVLQAVRARLKHGFGEIPQTDQSVSWSLWSSPEWSLDKLITREFRLAYHQGDSQQALQRLDLMMTVDTAVWGGLPTDRLYPLIHRSLEYDFWEPDELHLLREWISGEVVAPEQWQRHIDQQRSQLLTHVKLIDEGYPITGYGSSDELFGVAPTHVGRYLRFYRQVEELRGVGTRAHVWAVRAAIEEMDRARPQIALDNVVSIPDATCDLVAGNRYHRISGVSFALKRMNHRRVITAIAIKQFQIQEGRWPESLDELSKVGLTRSDWKMVANMNFGYRVDPGGGAARLWRAWSPYATGGTRMYNRNYEVPNKPPSERRSGDPKTKSAETVIR